MQQTRVSIIRLSLILIPAALVVWHGGGASRGASLGQTQGAPPRESGRPAIASAVDLQTLRNVGKAYYEQGKYPEAIERFQKVVASGAALATDHLNLGMALMGANKLDEALGEITTARQMDQRLLAAEYNLGILYKRELRYPDAEAALQKVASADPEDPAAWFNLGTVAGAERKLDACLDFYRHVLGMGFGRGQNFYVAALFRTFTALVRLERQDEAQKVLKHWESVRDRVPSISLQESALEAGKYGEISVPSVPPAAAPSSAGAKSVTFAELSGKLGLTLPPAPVPAFDPRRPIRTSEYSLDFARRNLLPLFGPTIAVGDYDNDGYPDLFVVVPAGTDHLFHNNGNGSFTEVTEKAGLAGLSGSLSATFADFDNSGKLGLFVAGLDGVKVYQYAGEGAFKDITQKTGLKPAPGELDTRALLFDADNDGFLDLVVTAYTDLNHAPSQDSFLFPADFADAGIHFYRNNGDGSFTDATASAGLAAARGRMRGALFADFLNRGYDDLYLFADDGPPLLYRNQGENKFVLEPAREGTRAARQAPVLEAWAADFNHDGYLDLAVCTASGCRATLNQRDGSFKEAPGPWLPGPSGPFAFRGAVADLEGNGFNDLIVADTTSDLHVLVNTLGRFHEAPLALPGAGKGEVVSLAPAWLASPGKLDLLAGTRDGRLRAFEKQRPPAHWIEVNLAGFKSNTRGIGSVVEIKAGNYYNKVVVSSSPLRVFTGALAKLDVLRVTWPNAVVQNWIDVSTDRRIEVRESERLASSCPFLYAWDGRKFAYVTDVLGTSPLGELASDGTRLKPYPEEFVRLPDWVRPSSGKYVFQLTAEMREADFFDQARMVAVDHPADEEAYANEIYSSNPLPPALYSVRRKHLPVSAVDDRGRDVLPLLLRQDGRYPTDFAHQRILGMADLHSLTLDLGVLPAPAPVSLWLNGWVFWTDSNGARALLSNRKLEMVPPYLQVRDASGKWVTVIPDIGLPSGTHRTMRVDLTGKFLSSDRHVRIVTNLCVYWDQIFFTTEESPAPGPVELPLAGAHLHYRGFSTAASDPAHLKPDWFDYEKVTASAPWNPLRGDYTRYGEVAKLLRQPDDQMVVMGAGDELTVEFSPRSLPRLKPGWKRDFFLRLRGYAKDGEPNTAFAWTVAPLPFSGMSNYPPAAGDNAPRSPAYREYQRQYQTRPGYLLIPPLAPAGR